MTFKSTIASLLAASCSLWAAASTETAKDSLVYFAELGTTLSSGQHTPLWLSANRYGFSSIERNNLWLRAGAVKPLNESKDFSWGAGVDLGVAHRFESVFIPQQIYGELKYRCLDLMIGQKEICDPMLDTDLSSGALTYGWNARPIPQIRAGIFDYANVWGCREMFAIKGYIAYGLFSDNGWIKRWVDKSKQYSINNYYCSRAIYFRGGNADKFPLEGELGLEMATEFGGKTWHPGNDGGGHWSYMPHGVKSWLKALIPMGGDKSTPAGEQLNVEGNYLGNWSFSLRWADPSGWSVRLYYQHFFEDHSMLFFDYPWKDGLYGAQAKLPANPFVSDIVYEFLYMKDQSGPVYWDHNPTIDYQVSGRDNYYNHYILNPWQHWGQAIGNPMLTSPIYNDPHAMFFYSTRVYSNHLGFKGSPCRLLDYRVLLSHTRSWGTYDIPFSKVKANFSWMTEFSFHPQALRGWSATLSLGGDHGSLLGNSFGVLASVSYSGSFAWQ